MNQFGHGDQLIVRNGRGRDIRCRAISGVMMGDDFPVVWACQEGEWEAAAVEDRPPEGAPWPAEDVRLPREGDQ